MSLGSLGSTVVHGTGPEIIYRVIELLLLCIVQ